MHICVYVHIYLSLYRDELQGAGYRQGVGQGRGGVFDYALVSAIVVLAHP